MDAREVARWYSVAQLAERWHMGRAFVRAEIDRRNLQAVRFGRHLRISADAVQAYEVRCGVPKRDSGIMVVIDRASGEIVAHTTAANPRTNVR